MRAWILTCRERQASSERLHWHPGTSWDERRSSLGIGQGCGGQCEAVRTLWYPVEGIGLDAHGCPPREAPHGCMLLVQWPKVV